MWPILLAACTPLRLVEDDASAATAIGGTAPWTVAHFTLLSTTDWDIYTAPSWAHICTVKNEHASGVLALGRYDETGTADIADATTDEFILIDAGGAYTFPVTTGSKQRLELPLTSITADLPVGVFCVESPE